MTTTAEGIEDAGQLGYLKDNGCIEGQGYLFSKSYPGGRYPCVAQSRTTHFRRRLIRSFFDAVSQE